MPGDWTLDLEKPTCGVDLQDCPYWYPRCDTCPKKNKTETEQE